MALIGTKGKGTITGTTIAGADVLVTNATTRDTGTGGVIFYNTHTSAVNVYVAVVNANGGAVGTPAATDVIWSAAIPAVTDIGNNWDIFDFSFPMLTTNDTVVAYASTTAVINWLYTYATIADQA